MYCKLRKLRNVNKLLLLLLSHDAGERLDCVYCGTANLNFSHATKFPLYLSFPVHFLSFPIISCSKTNKQERKKGRSVSWLRGESHLGIKLQTPEKNKEGRTLTESRLSRLYVSTSTFPGIPPSPSATPHPQPPPGSSSGQERKNKIYIFLIGRFDVRLTSLSSQKISVSCCLICCGE